MNMTSGESARWRYGALDPVPQAEVVHAGAARIAGHDAQFDPAKLCDWAAAATRLICQSLTSADATPARTFRANGLFRTYVATLELRANAGVGCAGAWEPASAVLVNAVSTPLFDEVRVRVTCQGWCRENHAPTGLTLRGGAGQGTWSEDLTFGRSADAISPAAGGLPASRCPSCGAPLDLDADGAAGTVTGS